MNEFSYVAEHYREYLEKSDLMARSMRLADMPCRPSEYNSAARQINGFLAAT